MKRHLRAFRKSNLLVLIIVLGCVAAFGMTAFSLRKQGTSFEQRQLQKRERLLGAELRIQNLTHGLTVIKAEKHVAQDSIRLLLRNDYGKIITAYKVAVGSGTIATECISEQEVDGFIPFRPGEIREEIYPLQVDVETLGIRVLSVVFDDNTSDGVPHYVREIQEYRLGLKMGMQQALERLEAVSELPPDQMPQALRKAQLEISDQPRNEGEVVPHFVKVGLHDVCARIAGNLVRNQNVLQEPAETASEKNGKDLITLMVSRLTRALNKL